MAGHHKQRDAGELAPSAPRPGQVIGVTAVMTVPTRAMMPPQTAALEARHSHPRIELV